ncbi:hypothetical protein MASR1M74_18630 [Lentimicrobium sp.]
MTKKILTITLMSALFVLAIACNRAPVEEGSCCKSEAAAAAEPLQISDQSLYLLNSAWETQNSEVKQLEAYKGKIVVASMFFSHCASACPRITADMKNIEDGLSPEEREKVQFLLITMDVKRDTPVQMKKYAENHRLGNRWELVRSNDAATMELANVLGVRIQPLEEGGFDHSNIIHILNPQGEIVYQQTGLNVNPEQSLLEIRKML